jgi:hypothetical protein
MQNELGRTRRQEERESGVKQKICFSFFTLVAALLTDGT